MEVKQKSDGKNKAGKKKMMRQGKKDVKGMKIMRRKPRMIWKRRKIRRRCVPDLCLGPAS